MSILAEEPQILPFADVLERIAGRGAELDRSPRFPQENFLDLRAAGVLGQERYGFGSLSEQIDVVRAVARGDASTARILDGHINGLERLAMHAPDELRDDQLTDVMEGRLLVGVWGADPRIGEGDPAWLTRSERGVLELRGVKVFCSGAGGVQRALVVARDATGERRLAYIDTTSAVRIDRTWYRASGLRASESHRVEFDATPVLALLGGSDELLREPYFSRDSVRSTAIWAGLSDGIAHAVAAAIAGEDVANPHENVALGWMRVHAETIDLWLNHATRRLGSVETPDDRCRETAITTRVAIAEASRGILACSAQACGSRALATLEELDRRRRDLEIFLLQHRLAPALERLGRATRRATA
jgi:hypothetical protein